MKSETPLTIAFCMFKYFPYGGLQRDFMNFLMEASSRGHICKVYCMSWQGDLPEQAELHILKPSGFRNHTRIQSFTKQLEQALGDDPVDIVFGFNKMPQLDLYYAADSCYLDKALTQRGLFYRMGGRFKLYAKYERDIFRQKAKTEILLISELEKNKFKEHYDTEDTRLRMLPPGIDRGRCAPDNWREVRAKKRAELKLKDSQKVMIFIGSGFIKKGLDRAIVALSSLPEAERAQTTLFVVGQDKEKRFRHLARTMGVESNVVFLGGRDDVSELLLMADLLIHPALDEAAGIVLLEAVVAGLPIIVTDVCGYAHFIMEAKAGQVLASPYVQAQLNEAVVAAFQGDKLEKWKANGIKYSLSHDLYGMHHVGIDILEAYASRMSQSSPDAR